MTDGSIRFLAGLSLAALAAITGIVSYLHALTVVYLTGSAGLVAYLIPFVADLMIVTASLGCCARPTPWQKTRNTGNCASSRPGTARPTC